MIPPPAPEEAETIERAVMAVVAEMGPDPLPVLPSAQRDTPRITAVQVMLLVLGSIAFLYFARPVILPVVLAFMAATALKPLMVGLGYLRIPTVPAALIVFTLLMAAGAVGFVEVGRPAMSWMDDAPDHMADLKTRALRLFPNVARMTNAVNAVNEISAPSKNGDGKQKVQAVEIHDNRGTTSILNWTGTVLAGLGEVLVLIYLLLSSGDMFMQKLVRVMPSLREKKRAVDITREVQTNISNYLFAVTFINIGLGAVAGVGFYFIGVPKPAMWGVLVALLNYVPYFGPIVGVILVGIVGMLSFDTLALAVMPGAWYLLLHLLESNFITPILLGRRFTLNPVAIFISLMFWLWLWGIPGALLSVPILVSIKSVCDRIPKALLVSEFIGRPAEEAEASRGSAAAG